MANRKTVLLAIVMMSVLAGPVQGDEKAQRVLDSLFLAHCLLPLHCGDHLFRTHLSANRMPHRRGSASDCCL